MRFSLIIFASVLTLNLYARPGYFEPWGKDSELLPASSQSPEDLKASSPSILVLLAKKAILFHQQVLSPVDGPRSHFRPSSSQYMLLAMQKHGFLKGFALGCDRLLRENSAPWVYQTIEEEGKLIKYNPVP